MPDNMTVKAEPDLLPTESTVSVMAYDSSVASQSPLAAFKEEQQPTHSTPEVCSDQTITSHANATNGDSAAVASFGKLAFRTATLEEPLGAGHVVVKKEIIEPSEFNEQSNDPISILCDATLIGLENHDVATTVDAFALWKPDPQFKSWPISRVIAIYAVRLKRKENPSTLQNQILYDVLRALFTIGGFNKAHAKMTGMDRALAAIMGDESTERPYAFPDPFPALANTVAERIEINSGFEEEDEVPIVPSASVPSESGLSRPKKRKRGDPAVPKRAKRTILNSDNATIRGLLDNIILGAKGSWTIIDVTKVKSSKNFGHNGLRIGQWWPLRISALKDGAHGAMQAGIAGNQDDGAFSIVISGGYEGMDEDNGDTVYYSGSNSHDNKEAEAQISVSTQSMLTSYERNRSIRVLRSAKGNATFAPKAGFRYDGLYNITNVDRRAVNQKGGAYVRFKLERKAGQEPIPRNAPTEDELAAYYKIG
ncbi:hypothetical protein ACLMJK_004356 [Lecanora helva]